MVIKILQYSNKSSIPVVDMDRQGEQNGDERLKPEQLFSKKQLAIPSSQQLHWLIELSLPEYAAVRAEYWRDVSNTVKEYLQEPTKDENWFKSMMRGIVELAFLRAALIAFTDGSGFDQTKLSVDLLAFVTAYKLAEFGFIESLVLALRARKYPIITTPEEEEDEELTDIIVQEIARKRADGYSQGLDILYNNTKVRSAGERILIFTGDDGMESCFDCQKYKGVKKPASWWVRNNAVPPNRDFECKGYNCLHILRDVLTGKVFTI